MLTGPRLRKLAGKLSSAAVIALGAWLLWRGITAVEYNWQWNRVGRYFARLGEDGWQAGPLIGGLNITLQLSIASLGLAIVGGLAIAALQEASLRSLRMLARAVIEVVRGTPQLVQLYLLYFMFSSALGVSPFAAGVISLGIFEAVFAAEIFRAGVAACPLGQREAARALGLGFVQIARHILLPQILPQTLPALANLLVNLIKHSAIVTVIAVPDMTDVARNLIADTFLVLELWLAIAAVYWVISFAATAAIRLWERNVLAQLAARSRAAV